MYINIHTYMYINKIYADIFIPEEKALWNYKCLMEEPV